MYQTAAIWRTPASLVVLTVNGVVGCSLPCCWCLFVCHLESHMLRRCGCTPVAHFSYRVHPFFVRIALTGLTVQTVDIHAGDLRLDVVIGIGIDLV